MTQAFAGQKIIVVGGTSGMGKAVAQLILQQGGAAVLIGSRQPKLEEAVTELSQYGTVVGELATRVFELCKGFYNCDLRHKSRWIRLNLRSIIPYLVYI
ncbi:SDR family NAD(P)-dependent oxidoreductase [Moorena sp. SIO4A1]|uniref:SDR family NAD(P)-dependent oxidoreductase n=1 Tax=Moorena sp. SIO4A1 TaxID=2607835 RepID=UPI0025E2C837|nr:SDR family NAD(P)-dependent oxidoreductase [Moorena sp. SIO4A1]